MKGYDPNQHHLTRFDPALLTKHLETFIRQIRTGSGECASPAFAAFASKYSFSYDENKVVWPLCFIRACFQCMGRGAGDEMSSLMARAIEDLAKAPPSHVESRVWECVVRVALGVSWFSAVQSSVDMAVLGVLPQERPELVVMHLPEDVETLSEAQEYIEEELEDYPKPTLVLAFPRFEKFPQFDVIIRFMSPPQDCCLWRGVQLSLDRASPSEDCSFDFPGVIIRPPDPNWQKRKHWRWLASEEIEAFLPFSLRPLVAQIFE